MVVASPLPEGRRLFQEAKHDSGEDLEAVEAGWIEGTDAGVEEVDGSKGFETAEGVGQEYIVDVDCP